MANINTDATVYKHFYLINIVAKDNAWNVR